MWKSADASSLSLMDCIHAHDRKCKHGDSDDDDDVQVVQPQHSEYYNADFILSSVAEVERLWSIARYILVDQQKEMTPQMFEALLFLKVNCHFWNQDLAVMALNMAQTECSED